MVIQSRTAAIEATTEESMMNRPCLYTVKRPGGQPEIYKSAAHRLSIDTELIACFGYVLIAVEFPHGFAQHETETAFVDILELGMPDAFGCTEVIITRD